MAQVSRSRPLQLLRRRGQHPWAFPSSSCTYLCLEASETAPAWTPSWSRSAVPELSSSTKSSKEPHTLGAAPAFGKLGLRIAFGSEHIDCRGCQAVGRHRKAAGKPKNHPTDLLPDPVSAANIPRILDLVTPRAVKKTCWCQTILLYKHISPRIIRKSGRKRGGKKYPTCIFG